VVDKGGEGLGSDFCRMYQAYKFCQSGSREECPSCRGTASYGSGECISNAAKCLSPADLTDAQNKCPTDPIFLDPEVKKQIAEADPKDPEKIAEEGGGGKAPPTTPPVAGAAGAAGSGGGGGLGGGGDGSAGGAAAEYGSAQESLPMGTAVGADSGGGGGGFGSGRFPTFGDEEDPTRRPSSGLSPQSSRGGGAEGLPQDVSVQNGPNVFSLSTMVYRSMCGRGSLSRCAAARPRRQLLYRPEAKRE
jgi:hypothetical protein